MNLSTVREYVLQSSFEVLESIGIPLVVKTEEGLVVAEKVAYDDLGFFYWVPFVAKTFSLTLEQALWWFDASLLFAGIASALVGFWFFKKTIIQFLIACLGVLLAAKIAWGNGSLYLVSFLPICFLPLFFMILEKGKIPFLLLYLFVLGTIASFSNSIRSHSGTALILIVLSSLFLYYAQRLRNMTLPTLFLVIGFFFYSSWFSLITQERNRLLTAQGINCEGYLQQHSFWHPFYVGLGFITNDLGISYLDQCGFEKVQSKDVTIVPYSPEYDKALKKEIIILLKTQFHYIMLCMWAKLSIILFYFLKYAGIGLLCTYFYRKPWFIEICYSIGMCWLALPGLIAIPRGAYLVGFFTLALFYSLHSLLWALQQGFELRSLVSMGKVFSKKCISLLRKIHLAW